MTSKMYQPCLCFNACSSGPETLLTQESLLQMASDVMLCSFMFTALHADIDAENVDRQTEIPTVIRNEPVSVSCNAK